MATSVSRLFLLSMSLLPSLFLTSFDDLVFEGRNQAYGAYQLRQSYNGHVRKALALMIALCALLLLSGTAWQRLHPVAIAARTVAAAFDKPIPPTYVTEAPKAITPPAQPSPPRMAAAPTPHQAANLPTLVVKDLTTPKPATPVDVMEVPPGLASTTTTTAEDGAATSAKASTGTAETGITSSNDNGSAMAGPYVVVEQMLEFAGGTAALMRYLRSHLRYPSAALAAQAEGRVFVSFVVQADGTIADISVPKGLGYGLDEEAQRVVRQMPAWMPGRQSNHAVAVRFTLPVTFRIQ